MKQHGQLISMILSRMVKQWYTYWNYFLQTNTIYLYTLVVNFGPCSHSHAVHADGLFLNTTSIWSSIWSKLSMDSTTKRPHTNLSFLLKLKNETFTVFELKTQIKTNVLVLASTMLARKRRNFHLLWSTVLHLSCSHAMKREIGHLYFEILKF